MLVHGGRPMAFALLVAVPAGLALAFVVSLQLGAGYLVGPPAAAALAAHHARRSGVAPGDRWTLGVVAGAVTMLVIVVFITVVLFLMGGATEQMD